MAQVKLLMPAVSSSSVDLKNYVLLKIQNQNDKPPFSLTYLSFSSLLSSSASLSAFKTLPVFKPETMPLFRKDKSKDQSKEDMLDFSKHFVPYAMALLVAIFPISYGLASNAMDPIRGAALFRKACIGCHDAGGNIIQPGATLFAKDLERNGVDSEEELYSITYNGKGRMPGFGEKCMPRGQCTFGPRLQDEEIRLLAQFVKLQADKGWPSIDIYGD